MIKRLLLATCFCLAALTPGFAAETTTAAATPALAPAAAASAPSNGIQLVWLVYVSGIRIGVVGLKTSFIPGAYSAVSNLKTGGLIGVFYDAQIQANAVGYMANATLRPRNYAADAMSRKRQQTQLAYSAAGIELSATPAYNTKRFPVSEEQKRDTLDPVSAMTFAISGISLTPQHPCGDTLHVFDGARRYDVEFKFVANVTLAPDEEGYGGPAVKCEIFYKQIAGFKPSVNQGKKTYPIYVWGAVFETQNPGPMKRFMVPVRIETDTSFGTAKAIARKIMVDGQRRTK